MQATTSAHAVGSRDEWLEAWPALLADAIAEIGRNEADENWLRRHDGYPGA